MKKDTFLSRISLATRLWLSFVFATFFPAAILLYYLLNFYAVNSAIIFVIVFVQGVGWWFVFDAFRSITKIHQKTNQAVSGSGLPVYKENLVKNEVEHLDMIFNRLALKVKESVEELKALSQQVEDLSTTDTDTGIYNRRFFSVRLDEEIRRATAYQRPCGLIGVEIVNYSEYLDKFGAGKLNQQLKQMVVTLNKQMRPIDILGRLNENIFGVILIERNRRQSRYFGLKFKEEIQAFFNSLAEIKPIVSQAVAENPLDGTNAAELLASIEHQLAKNK